MGSKQNGKKVRLLRVHKALDKRLRLLSLSKGVRAGTILRQILEAYYDNHQNTYFESNPDTYLYKLTRDPTRKNAGDPFRLNLSFELDEYLSRCCCESNESLGFVVSSIVLDYFG